MRNKPPTPFREWRRKLGLTQEEVAAALGYGRRQIQKYDGGQEPPPPVVEHAMVALAEHPERINVR